MRKHLVAIASGPGDASLIGREMERAGYPDWQWGPVASLGRSAYGVYIRCEHKPPLQRLARQAFAVQNLDPYGVTLMSKGSTVVPVRIPDELLSEVDARVERSKTHCKVPFDRSTFIRQAVQEKLDHYKRSARKGRNTPSKQEGNHAAG